jgi:2-desacetyl-2-hydroxyethyl bacteriochlorophyllide A dehydrogenase
MLICKKLFFTAPHQVQVCEEVLSALPVGHVLVETIVSAVSQGTEMLIYRGQYPRIPVDASIEGLGAEFSYPLSYGYACVGRIVETGSDVSREWLDRLVFAFQPHCSHFIIRPQLLIPVPEDLSPQNACFLPNTETAVNLVQDAAPILGERALVFGQGIIGLLTSALLVEFPLEKLVCVDPYTLRRQASQALGPNAVLDPTSPDFADQAAGLLGPGADLSIELSGSPDALNTAISLTRFSGRILIGSWYGEKQVHLNLGGTFHRSRIKLISSQVSTIAPELASRWDKSRRFEVAWNAVRRIQPEKWITHCYPLEQAPQVYRQLDENPRETIQAIFDYSII